MTTEHRDDVTGASTAQHITGSPETGEFLTDQPPTATTPATGSSNAGINARRANRADDQPGEHDDRQDQAATGQPR